MSPSSPPTPPTGGWTLDRLGAISDGVIAVVITLLVLGLEVPSVHNVPAKELGEYLIDSLFPIFGYLLSFVLIAMYWMQHYAMFHFLTHATRPFVMLNFLFLLTLSFLPFPTGLHAVYRHDELAVVLFGGAQILCGLSLLLLWRYATHNYRLVPDTIPQEVVASMNRRLAVVPLWCVVAIAVSFINPWLSRLIFVLIPFWNGSHRAVDAGWVKMQREGD